ncbi:hypothetical protein ATANTOWER_027993 [Ataeniobius toweri]|uniref:Uncharacterized protein n=1 Tax=Ataeniobius toweri TaxID=208326 RepID=A0ABU7C0V5_9TELE|nr:hypothetical protein [Ataeniobius toweri]
MALDMIYSETNVQEELKFLFENHPMARRGSWTDTSSQGFSGTAATKESIKSIYKEKFEGLKTVLNLEYEIFTKWKKTVKGNNLLDQFSKIAVDNKVAMIKSDYNQYKEALEHEASLIPPKDGGEPPSSGALGGHDDGYVTKRDLNSASELENSFRHEAYFSKASASLAEEIHTQLKKKFGEHLAGLQVKKGTDRIENGQFICQLESHSVDAEPVEFKVDLSAKTQKFHKELLRKMDRSVQDMQEHSLTSSHQVSKIVEHAGTAVGVLGFLLGAKGSVRGFEQGDIKGGVMGTLQTVHGTTALASSAVARTVLSSEARCAKAAVSIMKSPAMKRTMGAIPIIGIGFGIYDIYDYKYHIIRL